MEENTLHDLGQGLTGTARRDAAKQRVESPFEGMTCPSRRPAKQYAFKGFTQYRYCTLPIEQVSKTDYAANAGNIRSPEIPNEQGGPPEKGEDLLSIQASVEKKTAEGDPIENWNGICFYRSQVNMRSVEDGTSKTYMVGEKWLYFENYDTGLDIGDTEPAFTGCNTDTLRVTYAQYPLVPDTELSQERNQPTRTNGIGHRVFGSAHTGGFNMAMCDGSVDFVSFDIAPEVHAYRGGRNDGDVPPPKSDAFD